MQKCPRCLPAAVGGDLLHARLATFGVSADLPHRFDLSEPYEASNWPLALQSAVSRHLSLALDTKICSRVVVAKPPWPSLYDSLSRGNG